MGNGNTTVCVIPESRPPTIVDKSTAEIVASEIHLSKVCELSELESTWRFISDRQNAPPQFLFLVDIGTMKFESTEQWFFSLLSQRLSKDDPVRTPHDSLIFN